MQVKRHERVARRRRLVAAGSWLLAALALAGCGRDPEPIDADAALEHLTHLSRVIGPRAVGGAGEARAARYVAERLLEMGLATRVDHLDGALDGAGNFVRFSGANVLAELPAGSSDAPRVLLAAHHDTAGDGDAGPGGAAAVAVLLEVARVLAASPPAAKVLFGSFTGGEVGHLGARAFLDRSGEPPVDVVLHLDDLAGRRLLPVSRPSPPERWTADLVVGEARRLDLDRVGLDPLDVLRARRRPSRPAAAHAVFLERGIPAMTLAGDAAAGPPAPGAPAVAPEVLQQAGELAIGWIRGLRAGRDPWSAAAATYVPAHLPFLGVRVLGPAALILVYAAQPLLFVGLLVRWRRRATARAGPVLRALGAALLTAGLMAAAMGVTAWLTTRATGWRQPWTTDPGWHLAGAAAAAGLGWLAGASLARRGELPRDRGIWEGLTSILLLLPAAGLAAAGRADAGWFLAAASTGVLLSVYVDAFLLRASLVALAAWPLWSLLPGAWRSAGLVEGLALLALWLGLCPFVAYALGWWLQRSSGPRRGRGVVGAAVLGAAWLGLFLWNTARPVYDAAHPRRVQVHEAIDLAAGRARLTLRSAEPLRRLRTGVPGQQTLDTTRRQWSTTLPAQPEPPECVATPEPDGWTRVVLRPPRGAADPVALQVRSRSGRLAPPEGGGPQPELRWSGRDRRGEFAFRVAPSAEDGTPWRGEAVFRLRGELLGLGVQAPDAALRRSAELRLPLGGAGACGGPATVVPAGTAAEGPPS